MKCEGSLRGNVAFVFLFFLLITPAGTKVCIENYNTALNDLKALCTFASALKGQWIKQTALDNMCAPDQIWTFVTIKVCLFRR